MVVGIFRLPGWRRFGSIRLRFVHGGVRAVPAFRWWRFLRGCFCTVSSGNTPLFPFRLRFLTTAPTVPVAVPAKMVPAVPESGSVSVPPQSCFVISGPQKGPAERGHVKKRQKSSKKCQKYFRHFSTFFAQGKKRQKSSKSVNNNFDTFRQFSRGTSFPAQNFWGALTGFCKLC